MALCGRGTEAPRLRWIRQIAPWFRLSDQMGANRIIGYWTDVPGAREPCRPGLASTSVSLFGGWSISSAGNGRSRQEDGQGHADLRPATYRRWTATPAGRLASFPARYWADQRWYFIVRFAACGGACRGWGTAAYVAQELPRHIPGAGYQGNCKGWQTLGLSTGNGNSGGTHRRSAELYRYCRSDRCGSWYD